METYNRFVALGDSQVEGMNDYRPDGTLRGWADRLAERLAATTSPDLLSANLAVRRVGAAHVREVQLPRALELQPDLATVVVGMNDVLRPGFDLAVTMDHIETTLVALTRQGAEVVSMTAPDVVAMFPSMRHLGPRQRALHAAVRELHADLGVRTLELTDQPMNRDPGLWDPDRLHGSPEGHRRVAEGMALMMGLPGDEAWADLRPPRRGPVRTAAREAWWWTTYLGPWVAGRVRARNAPPEAQPVCKRPDLERVADWSTTARG
ncbi:SGNH/GDSL hydrolase family protein [Nocardioidaceae bacterium]|nr:SGNH/GDSL hydrolase family protein [Nocardioidaceae bacterium]